VINIGASEAMKFAISGGVTSVEEDKLPGKVKE
jgi:hypothetical protein